MDLPLWDSSASYESGYYPEDYLLRHFSFGYGRDLLEEDALNEKSCLQVLKIWIDKADEDIVKLEDDILMLQCQLAWDDEDWSKQCSAALREKIDNLDILIQSLKKDDREDGLQFESEELPPRLHDLLKPLLENYLAKRKQTETRIIQMPVPPAVELSNKKSEASTSNDNKRIEKNECTTMLKTYERKSKSTEFEERKINHPEQKKDAVITGFNASAHTCPHDEVSENFRSKPNTLEGRRMPNLFHVKSEPADPMGKESSASTPTEIADSREKEEKRNNDNKVIYKANVIEDGVLHEVKVTNSPLKLQESGSQISETVEVGSKKQRTEASSKVRKGRVYKRSIIKNAIPVAPSVKMEEKGAKFPETPVAVEALKTEMKNPPCSLNDRTEHVKKPRIKVEPQIQVQQRCGILSVVISQAKSIPAWTPEGRGPQKKCKENRQNSFMAEHIDEGPSYTENLMGQKKNGVAEGMSKKGEKNTQQQLNKNNIAGASEGTATPIFLLQEVSKLSFSSQTRTEKEDQSSVMKLATTEDTYGVKNVPGISSLFIEDKERLTLNDLRAIAKSKKLRCYSKLRKEELRKLLGL